MAYREELDPDAAERLRDAVRAVMDGGGLRPHPWATSAGVSSGSLYAFLAGRSNHLSTPVLAKLAATAGVPLSVLTGEAPPTESASVDYAMRGDAISRSAKPRRRPVQIPPGILAADMRVAEVTTETNAVLRPGALVYWSAAGGRPQDAIGKLSICELEGAAGMVVADVRPAFSEGAVLLVTVTGRIMEEARITAAWPLLWVRAPE